jgi:hypothetical protein
MIYRDAHAVPFHGVIWHNPCMNTMKAAAFMIWSVLLACGAASGGDQILTDRAHAVAPILAVEDDAFLFAVYGDRTGGPADGIEILKQAVADTNLVDPDFVMTVGDLIQGYNTRPAWIQQMKEYRSVMSGLNCPWFPVAGNHDIYWRGPGRPATEHEEDFESFFGPLWYAFDHKECRFIVLFTDEGDPKTGKRTFSKPESQVMSSDQKSWLKSVLDSSADMRHVFVFCHHPRWRGGRYGNDWQHVHDMLVEAGNVTAVMAGHVHNLQHDGRIDGIEYLTLATVGGGIKGDSAAEGFLHHVNLVMVRDDGIAMATVPVGAVIDPREMTPEHMAGVEALIQSGPAPSNTVSVGADGVVSAEVPVRLVNPMDVPVTWTLVARSDDQRWHIRPDHLHEKLAPGEFLDIPFELHHPGPLDADWSIPSVSASVTFRDAAGSWEIPGLDRPFSIVATALPAPAGQGVLRTSGGTDGVVIPSEDVPLGDGPLTLEAWIKPEDLDGRRGVVTKTEGSEYGLFASDWTPSFHVFIDGDYRTANATSTLTPNQWHHLAGVYDGNEVRLYVDGKRVASETASGSRKQNDLPLVVGGDVDRGGKPNSGTHGLLDEVRLSSIARYAGDSMTPSHRHTEDADTLLLLRFDGIAGPFIRDDSPGNAHGILSGSAKVDESVTRE